MNHKANNYLKYIAVVLVIVFLATAALMFIELWERNQGDFSLINPESSVVTYEGKKYVPKNNIDSFLVLGLDKFEDSSETDSYNNDKQADFLMLFVFDNDSKQCTAVQINRDTMAKVHILAVDEMKVVDTVTKQIALAHTYGRGKEASCRNTKESVENLLCNISINHYISFTMDSVPALNDLVGGVEITVLDDLTGIDSALIAGETVTLSGDQALRYVRARGGLEDSTNIARMKRQRQYINALYEKTISCIKADESFVANLVTTMGDYVVYDSSEQKLKKFAEKFDEYEFMGIREIEGESKVGDKFMEFYPDEDSIWKIVIELFYTPKK